MATFTRTKAGNWQARVVKNSPKPLYATFRTKAMAEQWATRKEDALSQRNLRDYGTAEVTTLSKCFADYQKEITPRKSSQQQEESRLKILTRELGNLTLIQLTPQEIISYVDRRQQTITSESVRKEIATLSQVWKTARALWQINLPENPVTIAREILSVTRTLKPGQERIRRLKKGEYARIMKHAPESVKPVIDFALETGMRRGEILNARREHVHGHFLRIPETKTEKPRTIPLSKKALQILKKAPKQGFLFVLRPDSVTQGFNRACKRAEIEDLRFHDLRHEAISRLFEKGLAVQEVAAISGHSDWRTLKRYTHVLPETIAKKLA